MPHDGRTLAGLPRLPPAFFLWGFDTNLLQITILAMSGGLLVVRFMIPLRPFLIVREHRNLLYPEGTACAEVLKVESGNIYRSDSLTRFSCSKKTIVVILMCVWQ